MVRFIIEILGLCSSNQKLFTFQYGQIYYCLFSIVHLTPNGIYIPIWLDLLCTGSVKWTGLFNDLHSNMVRFIMITLTDDNYYLKKFTFQYGQIYYSLEYLKYDEMKKIYIPIWLDLLYLLDFLKSPRVCHLHSNMVRFII